MLYEALVEEYYARNLNCAEAILLGADKSYGYGLSEDCYKLLGAFGAGCGVGSLCGAVAAAVAVIGRATIASTAHETPALKPALADFFERFEKRRASTMCRDIKPGPDAWDPQVRCIAVIHDAADALEETMRTL